MGRSLFPPAPDMRRALTQELSDGALWYAIEQGVPFTGMPAWPNGIEEGARESWELVLFIRHLPEVTTTRSRKWRRSIRRARPRTSRSTVFRSF